MIRYAERGLAVLLVFALAIPLSAAQEEKQKTKPPSDWETIYGLALGAPPEFAAAALLRVSEKVTDTGLRAEFLNMAFNLAAAAHHPYRLEALPGTEPDTPSNSTASALKLNFDGLYLQSRAVQMMLAIQPSRGRQMFEQLRRPDITPATCDTTLLPEVSAYYEAVNAVMQSGFNSEEKARLDDLSFAVTTLSQINQVPEVAPAAAFAALLNLPRGQMEIVVGTLASRLEDMQPDSRSYLASAASIDTAIGAVVAKAKSLGAPVQSLTTAYRAFLVKQLKAPRCGGAGPAAGRFVQGGATGLFGDEIRGGLAPLSAEESTPEKTLEAKPAPARYWQSEPSQRVYQEMMKLRRGPDGSNYTAAARKSPEWQRQFSDVLNSMAGWKASDEKAEADYFHQKATAYQALLELAPDGDDAERVMAGFVAFLRNSNLQQTNPAEWFWHARSTLERVRADQPQRAAQLAAAYQNSGSIILVLESKLNEVAPKSLF